MVWEYVEEWRQRTKACSRQRRSRERMAGGSAGRRGCGVGDSVGPDRMPELLEVRTEAAAWVEGEACEVEVDDVGEGASSIWRS